MQTKVSLALVFVAILIGFIPEARATVTFSVLTQLGINATGSNPNPVVLGADGNFYGTTTKGGANNAGVVFQITPGGTLTDLHDFAGETGSQARSLPRPL
jgi:uncharacterized repeat protein (TIGR03803 family)